MPNNVEKINPELLTEKERSIIAFSVFSTSMKMGPTSFIMIDVIVEKLDIRKEFEFYAKDWIEYAVHNATHKKN